ncbi:bifunctional hydroxymethylpyrimidine kinase/phosphomethylpyrimidine kinase [bacterium]|nr:bifunctional hydroxymethylpyrimidine kinase/phosphomethylpyrimidine kinase [bacterium]
MTVNIVVVGSIALDTVSTPKGKRDRVLGGSAVYFSTVVSYFTRVGLVGVCGRDFGNENIQFLKDHSVDLEGFEQVDGLTFNWNGSYSDDFGDATTHSTCLNVFQSFDPKLPASYASTPYLFLANIHPALQLKVIERVKAPKLVALDTMNFWIEGALPDLKKALPRVDVLFLNRQEAYMLSGTKKLVSAYKKLLEMGPKRVVIKLGELGAMTATQSETFFVPAFPCPNLSDPTGAGDSFAGGFMGYLAQTGETSEIGFRRAMLYGTVMGSFTVEQFGLDSYNTLVNKSI